MKIKQICDNPDVNALHVGSAADLDNLPVGEPIYFPSPTEEDWKRLDKTGKFGTGGDFNTGAKFHDTCEIRPEDEALFDGTNQYLPRIERDEEINITTKVSKIIAYFEHLTLDAIKELVSSMGEINCSHVYRIFIEDMGEKASNPNDFGANGEFTEGVSFEPFDEDGTPNSNEELKRNPDLAKGGKTFSFSGLITNCKVSNMPYDLSTQEGRDKMMKEMNINLNGVDNCITMASHEDNKLFHKIVSSYTVMNDKFISMLAYVEKDNTATFMKDGIIVFEKVPVEVYKSVINHFDVYLKVNFEELFIRSIDAWIINGVVKSSGLNLDDEPIIGEEKDNGTGTSTSFDGCNCTDSISCSGGVEKRHNEVDHEKELQDRFLDTDERDLPGVFRVTEDDNINPSHYTSMAISPHKYIKANSISWNEAQVIKYISRWKAKNGKEDLLKAKWYLDDLIDNL